MATVEPRFVDARMSSLLDLVRGGAASAVLLGHVGQLGFFGAYWPLDNSFQHSAVIVFFVLSGLMIQQSVARGDVTPAMFARARVSRILPVALFSVVLSTTTFWFLTSHGVFVGNGDRFHYLCWQAIAMPLAFLSERSGGVGPVLNPPFWSLCYEVWFYAIYAAWRFTGGARRIVAVGAVLILADLPIAMLLPTWLIGAALGRWGARVRATRPRTLLVISLAAFALCCWAGLSLDPLVIPLTAAFGPPDLHFSTSYAMDFLGGLAVAGALVALAALPWQLARCQSVARRAARLSFTLYLTHWPILTALRIAVADAPLPIRAAAALLVPLAVAAALSPLLEEVLPAVLRQAGLSGRGRPAWLGGASLVTLRAG